MGPPMPCSTLLWPVAAFCFIAQAVLAAIQTRFATSELKPTNVYGLALAASVLDIFALGGLLVAVVVRLRGEACGALKFFHATTVIISVFADVLTIYCISWMEKDATRREHGWSNNASILAIAGIAFCAITPLAQITFYALLLQRGPRDQPSNTDNGHGPDHSSFIPAAKQSLFIHLATRAPAPFHFARGSSGSHLSDPPTDLTSSQSTAAMPMPGVLRPITSKTKLLMRPLFASESVRSLSPRRKISYDTVRGDDGFESWDTSAVEERNDHSLPNIGSGPRLETIPASRPVSSARPLEEPLVRERPSEELPLPGSPIHSPVNAPSPPSPDIDAVSGMLPPPRRLTSNAQSRIHPLFRSESPDPPPVASPGTVITASPMAGQVVSSEQVWNTRRALLTSSSQHSGFTLPVPDRGRRDSATSLRSASSFLQVPASSTTSLHVHR